jgi:hypothetical protein
MVGETRRCAAHDANRFVDFTALGFQVADQSFDLFGQQLLYPAKSRQEPTLFTQAAFVDQ